MARVQQPKRPVQSQRARQTKQRTDVAGRLSRVSSASQQVALHWFSRLFRAQSALFYQIFFVTVLIAIFGLAMVLSSSAVDSIRNNAGNAFATSNKQVGFALVGFTLLIAGSLFTTRFMHAWAKRAFLFAFFLQLLVIPLGVSVNGNKAWLQIGEFRLQPSEFLKVGLILMLAWLMQDRAHETFDRWRYLFPILGVGFFVVLAVAGISSDVGTALVIVLIIMMMLWLSGIPRGYMGWPVLVTAVLAFGAVMVSPSRRGRVWAFFDPSSDVTGAYTDQTVHGVWALAAGRITGVNLGQSKMKWTWIPEVENDFIFAIIGEELGLIGALGVIALFVYLGVLIMRVAMRASTVFGRMLVTGICIWIFGQAVINIAVVLNLFPVLGVPLPLISAGGSSLISGLGAIGLVLAVERENHLQDGGPARQKRVKR